MLHDIDLVDALKFITKNRKGEAFKDWTRSEILNQLEYCSKNKINLVTLNELRDITGIALGYYTTSGIHVLGLLCLDRSSFKQILDGFLNIAPRSFHVSGFRHKVKDKPKVWNLKQVCKIREKYV